MKRIAQLTKAGAKKSLPVFDVTLFIGGISVVVWAILH